jgi:hypothetical protein
MWRTEIQVMHFLRLNNLLSQNQSYIKDLKENYDR